MAEHTGRPQTVVLIVEDDRFLRTLLSEKLKQEGIFVVVAENGKDALIKMKEDPRPHLILLDLLLPIVDGFDVLQQMQKDPDVSKIPVIVLSNLGQEEDIRRAKGLGAKDYMVKAYFTPSEIVEKVQALVRSSYM